MFVYLFCQPDIRFVTPARLKGWRATVKCTPAFPPKYHPCLKFQNRSEKLYKALGVIWLAHGRILTYFCMSLSASVRHSLNHFMHMKGNKIELWPQTKKKPRPELTCVHPPLRSSPRRSPTNVNKRGLIPLGDGQSNPGIDPGCLKCNSLTRSDE